MKTEKESFWAELYGAAFVGVLASPIAIVFLLPFLILQKYSGDSFNLAESWWLFVWAGTSAGVLIGKKFSEDENKKESPSRPKPSHENKPQSKFKTIAWKVLDNLLAIVIGGLLAVGLVIQLWGMIKDIFS